MLSIGLLEDPHRQIHFRVGMRQMKLCSQGLGLHLGFLNRTPWKSHTVAAIGQFEEHGLFPLLCFFSFNGVQLALSSLLPFSSHSIAKTWQPAGDCRTVPSASNCEIFIIFCGCVFVFVFAVGSAIMFGMVYSYKLRGEAGFVRNLSRKAPMPV